ncbi:histidine phosphatase family protein, partial [Candidatus Auribacterota bacterium]
VRIYLIQHGEATSEQENSIRPLNDIGRENVTKIASFLKIKGLKPAVIWHSQKLRAKETAGLLYDTLLPAGGIKEKHGLSPNDSPQPIFSEFLNQTSDVMIVGHLPFLNKLASLILTREETAVSLQFQNAGVVCFENNESGQWALFFLITPNLS